MNGSGSAGVGCQIGRGGGADIGGDRAGFADLAPGDGGIARDAVVGYCAGGESTVVL